MNENKGPGQQQRDGTSILDYEDPTRLRAIDAEGAAARLRAGDYTNPDAATEGPPRRRGWPKGRKRARKTKLAVLGIPSGVLDTGNPAYARCVRLASAYRKVRVRELTVSHGYVSSGTAALLASAAHSLAASRFLYERATEASGEDMLNLLKVASKLSDSARQNELAAWELAAREGVARRKLESVSSGLPWIVPVSEHKRSGPKRKDQRDDMLQLPPPGSQLTGWVQEAEIDEPGRGSETESKDGPGKG